MSTDPPPKRDTLIAASDNQAMFNRIAKRYDLMNKIISMGLDKKWRKRAIQTLGPERDGRYLDVGAGTGDLLIEIAETASGAIGNGIDPAREMMAIGRRKTIDAGLDQRISFQSGDAMRLPYRDDVFDGVILGFCIRNVEDRMRALAEFLRVLRPAGRLVILELTVPSNGISKWGHRIFTSTVVPVAARLLSLHTAYAYLIKSVRAFPPRAIFEEMMRETGFEGVRGEPLTMGAVTVFSGRKPAFLPQTTQVDHLSRDLVKNREKN